MSYSSRSLINAQCPPYPIIRSENSADILIKEAWKYNFLHNYSGKDKEART